MVRKGSARPVPQGLAEGRIVQVLLPLLCDPPGTDVSV